MDDVLKSEIVMVLLDEEEGILFEKFAGLFHQVHGYQLKLSNYGYKSLKALLDDMKDLVELHDVNGQQLIKYRHPPEQIVISPSTDVSSQEEVPNVLEIFSSPLAQFQPSADLLVNSTANPNMCYEEPVHSIYANTAKGNSLSTTQKPACQETSTILHPVQLNDLLFSEDKITGVLKEFNYGVKVERLRKHILLTHGVDLEVFRKEWGYTDIPSLLKQMPGIVFIKENIVIASEHCHAGKPQPLQPKQAGFTEDTITDFMRMYPSGLTISKMSRAIKKKYNINLQEYSKKMGYADMLTMLRKLPGVAVVINVVFPSDVSEKCKSHLVQQPKKASNFSAPQDANKQAKKKVSVVQKTGSSASSGHPKPVNQKQCSDPSSTSRLSTVTKNTANVSTSSKKDKANDSRPSVANKANIQSSNISKINYAATTTSGASTAPVSTSVTSQNLTSQPVYQVLQGVNPSISYAAALAGNQRRNPFNQNTHQYPVKDNLHTAHVPAVAQPKFKAETRSQSSNSIIRDNLQNLLKSYAHGLSIFQLQKLYLLKFQQPFVRKGLPVKQLLMEMRDLAKVQGVGVQMQVFPASSATSNEINSCSDDTQGTRLTPKDWRSKPDWQAGSPGTSAEHIQQGTPVTLTQLSSSLSGHTDTKSAGRPSPNPYSGSNSHMQSLLHNQKFIQKFIQNDDINGKNSSNPTSKTPTLFPSNKNMDEPPHHSGAGQNISTAEWPALPQKFTILKQIKESAVSSRQLHVNKEDDKLGLKQETAQSSQPQAQDATAVTSQLQPCHDLHKPNGKRIRKRKKTQAFNDIGPIPHSDITFETIKTSSHSPSLLEVLSSKPIYDIGKTVSVAAPPKQDIANSQMGNMCEPAGSAELQLPYNESNSQARNQMETPCFHTEERLSELITRKHESQVPTSGLQNNEVVNLSAKGNVMSTSSIPNLLQKKTDFIPTRGQTTLPKQEMSPIGNRCELGGSPELLLPNKMSNSQVKNQIDTQCSYTEKRPSQYLAAKPEGVSPPEMLKNEIHSSAKRKGLSTSSTPYLLQKHPYVMPASSLTTPPKLEISKSQIGYGYEPAESPELQLPNKMSNSLAKSQVETQCSHREKRPSEILSMKPESQVSPPGMLKNDFVPLLAEELSTSRTSHLLEKKIDFMPTSGQTTPPNQEMSKSHIGNRYEPGGPPELQLPNNVSNFQAKNQMESQCSHTEKRPSEATKPECRLSPPGRQKNEFVLPDMSRSFTSYSLQKKTDFMPANGQMGSNTQKDNQHLEARVGETRSPYPSFQQNQYTSQIFKNENTMNTSFHSQLGVPCVQTSTTELNRSLPGLQQWHYYTAGTSNENGESLTNQQVSDLHSTLLEEDDQLDQLNNSEDSKTWQKDKEQFCCIL